jgi:hypothetical protein
LTQGPPPIRRRAGRLFNPVTRPHHFRGGLKYHKSGDGWFFLEGIRLVSAAGAGMREALPMRRLACAQVPLARPGDFALDAAGKGCNTAGNAGPAMDQARTGAEIGRERP